MVHTSAARLAATAVRPARGGYGGVYERWGYEGLGPTDGQALLPLYLILADAFELVYVEVQLEELLRTAIR